MMDDSSVLEQTPAFHGYAPPSESHEDAFRPPLTITVSREAGARGTSVATRVAKQLGWQLISQEMLEYMSQDATLGEELVASLSPAAKAWVDEHLEALIKRGPLGQSADVVPLARLILQVAAAGEHIILGRGAGCVVPTPSKLHVRLVAPEKDRIAFIAQIERLSMADAERVVRDRDQSRREFITKKFGRSPTDLLQYDLILNTSLLGVETAAAVVAAAAQAKMARM